MIRLYQPRHEATTTRVVVEPDYPEEVTVYLGDAYAYMTVAEAGCLRDQLTDALAESDNRVMVREADDMGRAA